MRAENDSRIMCKIVLNYAHNFTHNSAAGPKMIPELCVNRRILCQYSNKVFNIDKQNLLSFASILLRIVLKRINDTANNLI